MQRWSPSAVLLTTIAASAALLVVAVLILNDPLVLKGYGSEPDLQVCPPTLIALTSGASLDFNDLACGDFAGVMLTRAVWPLLGALGVAAAGAVLFLKARAGREATSREASA